MVLETREYIRRGFYDPLACVGVALGARVLVMAHYEVDEEAVERFLKRKPVTNADDLKEVLATAEEHAGKWQVLSAHASQNAARTKLVKIRRGLMAGTLKSAKEGGLIELGVTANATLGPAVVLRWVV